MVVHTPLDSVRGLRKLARWKNSCGKDTAVNMLLAITDLGKPIGVNLLAITHDHTISVLETKK